MMLARVLVPLLVLSLAACPDGKSKDVAVREAKVVPTTVPLQGSDVHVLDPRDLPNVPSASEQAAADAAASAAKKKKDGTKGDQQDNEWIPAEFKSGASRWK